MNLLGRRGAPAVLIYRRAGMAKLTQINRAPRPARCCCRGMNRRRLSALPPFIATPALAQQRPGIRTITEPAGETTMAGDLAGTKARGLFVVVASRRGEASHSLTISLQ